MDIVVLLSVLAKRKWYLIGIPLFAALATYFLTVNIKPVFKSSARLATSFTTDDQIKIDDERINLRDANVKFNNLIQTMNSEVVLTMLSYKLMINDLTSDKPFRKANTNDAPPLTADEKKEAAVIFKQKYDSLQLLSTFNPQEAKLLKLLSRYEYSNWQIKDDFEIRWVKDTDYITVQFASENPFLSAFVVNAVSEEYIRYDNSLKADRSDQSVTFFESLVAEKKRKLDENTALLNQFKVSSGVINFEAESSTKMSQISEYELRKEQLLSDIQRLKISLASVNKKIKEVQGNSDNSSATTDQATINANIVKIREKIRQLDDEYVKNGSTNQELLNSIKELRYQLQVETSKLATTGGTVRSSLLDLMTQKEQYELELQIAEANLQNVVSMIGSLRGNVSGQATKEASIGELQREVDNATQEYLQALDRFNTEQSKSLISRSPVRIIVRGQPNGHAEFSKRYLMVALSGVASFALCVFTIIFIEFFDVRIKTPQQFKKFVRINLIGSVNGIDSKKLNLIDLFSSNDKGKEMEIFKHFLRKLRFEIESSKSKVLLITSTKPGEGKTFITVSVAYLLSLLQKRVLIIDTNFKHNSLTQIMLKKGQNIKKLEHGVFIKGRIGQGGDHEMNEEDFASTIIYPTMHKGISIIGNNGGNESPSEIFAGKDFGKMITTLSENFDYIILEGASINNYSDSKELIDFVDKVIAVFSADSVIKQLDRESIDYLRSLNGKLMGAVLNKINTKELTV